MNGTNDTQPPALPSDTPTSMQPEVPGDYAPPPYFSPTLLLLAKNRRPSPSTICEICPASVWFTTAETVECYCRVMHLKSWTGEEPRALNSCDGQVQAEMERMANLMNPGG